MIGSSKTRQNCPVPFRPIKGGTKLPANVFRKSIVSFTVLAFLPETAFAYIDPGTGAMLVQALLAVIAAFLFYLRNPKTLLSDLTSWIKRLRSKRQDP
jgi:hypothetical protein